MKKTITHLEHPRQSHMVGDGFRVTQYIPGYGRVMTPDTSPFLMLDYNKPWIIAPQGDHRPGVGFHPHRGFETVTLVYAGEIEHQDTAGNGGIIGPDEVQWMTAGSGLLHNEFMTGRFSKRGGMQHAVQLWVDLPQKDKMMAPHYQSLTRENIPEVSFDGGKVRVIAGEFEGRKGAAHTYSPIELYDIHFDSSSFRASQGGNDGYTGSSFSYEGINASIVLSLPDGYNTMILLVEGSADINDTILENGDMVSLSQNGSKISIMAKRDCTRILLMSGKPLEQAVVQHGPFVMNTDEEIRQAWADFHSGKMG